MRMGRMLYILVLLLLSRAQAQPVAAPQAPQAAPISSPVGSTFTPTSGPGLSTPGPSLGGGQTDAPTGLAPTTQGPSSGGGQTTIHPSGVSPTSIPVSGNACSDPPTNIQATIVVQVRGDPDGATDSQLASFTNAFLESYNTLNTPTNSVCDPFQRALTGVTDIAIVSRQNANRRVLEQASPRTLQIFFGSNMFYALVLTVSAMCRGCPAESLLFDDVSGRFLVLEQTTIDLDHEQSSLPRDLQTTLPQCSCPVGSELRPPREIEFEIALDDNIQERRMTGEIEFIEELVDIEEVETDTPPTSPKGPFAQFFQRGRGPTTSGRGFKALATKNRPDNRMMNMGGGMMNAMGMAAGMEMMGGGRGSNVATNLGGGMRGTMGGDDSDDNGGGFFSSFGGDSTGI